MKESPPAPRPARPLPRASPSLDLTAEAMRAATDLCSRFAIGQIATLHQQPSWDLEGAAQAVAAARQPLPESGAPLESVLETLGLALPKSLNTAGPGYLAYIPGGGLYPAALGDYLALALNRYVGVASAAPALAQMEVTAIDWLRQLVGYPAGARGLLTTGGSMSNLIAIATARRDRLPEDFRGGVMYMSEETHHSLAKAALLAGFAEDRLRRLPADARCRLEPQALEEAVRADRERGLTPFLVIANAGTTNTGAIDPLPAIADVCRRHGLWLHVDGAYGGFFRLAPGGETLLPGLERADSLTLDPHKGLFLPYGTGCLLVRDPTALSRAHGLRASYLQDLGAPDQGVSFADISPELSREFRGLRLWLPLAMFGAAAFRDNLREKLELARWAWEELRGEPGVECVDEPQLSIVAFRCLPPKGDADAFGARVLQELNARRRVFISSTRMRGRYVLRFCVLSFRTHAPQMQMAVEDLRQALRAARA